MAKRAKQAKVIHDDALIDDAGNASFPASDPPSWTATGSGPAGRTSNGVHRNGHFLRDTVRTGAIAAVGTGLAATLLGKRQTGNSAAALNAVSHILWGKRAARSDRFDLAHTVAGVVLNSGAAWLWSAVAHGVFARSRRRGLLPAIAVGVGTATLAYVTDYHLVPERLTPGFELRLSKRGLFMIYGVLAGALAIGLSRSPRRAID